MHRGNSRIRMDIVAINVYRYSSFFRDEIRILVIYSTAWICSKYVSDVLCLWFSILDYFPLFTPVKCDLETVEDFSNKTYTILCKLVFSNIMDI